jgi:N-acetylglucosamine-6-phosphate deacetylase
MSTIRALTAKTIFDGQSLLDKHAILVQGGQIVDIIAGDQVTDQSRLEDYGDQVLSPGLIDLQLNGCGGVLFNDAPTLATLETMHATNLRFGTTSFLPTLITTDFAQVKVALNTIQEWISNYGLTRGVIGLHLEGPFISESKRGIHPRELIRAPLPAELELIASYRQYFPIKITLAPETVTPAQIEYLVSQGIIVALGHTNCSYAQAATAFKHGATAVTHLFNAMSGLTGRNPGLIGAALNGSCYLGLIADLLHVDAANIELVAKYKPTLTYLVTDAVTPTGTNMREFDFAGKHLWVEDGRCIDAEGTLGGAYLTLNTALKNCVSAANLPLAQALMMATTTPAKVMGLEAQLGRLAKDYPAQIIALNPQDFSCQLISST